MADPLSVLREYHMNKKPIAEDDDQIIFGEYSWPKTVKTNYLVTLKKGSPQEYYSLQSLVHFLDHLHLPHPDYVRETAAENIPSIRRPDRNQLLSYLKGKSNTAKGIDKSASLGFSTRVKRPNKEQDEEAIKKMKHEDE